MVCGCVKAGASPEEWRSYVLFYLFVYLFNLYLELTTSRIHIAGYLKKWLLKIYKQVLIKVDYLKIVKEKEKTKNIINKQQKEILHQIWQYTGCFWPEISHTRENILRTRENSYTVPLCALRKRLASLFKIYSIGNQLMIYKFCIICRSNY